LFETQLRGLFFQRMIRVLKTAHFEIVHVKRVFLLVTSF
jgi:hypothetical protein